MGLDVMPMGKSKPGFEDEWARAMSNLYAGGTETPQQFEHRINISILPYEDLGAPRVGYDKAANAWMLTQKSPNDPSSDKEFLEKQKGYYAIELLMGTCDGISKYSHGGLYEGVDRTSFRGAFLNECSSLLDNTTLEKAWTVCMPPEEAVAYGKALLALAQKPALAEDSKPKGFFAKLFKKQRSQLTQEEQAEILNSAGKWYIYWGSRGNPINAYF